MNGRSVRVNSESEDIDDDDDLGFPDPGTDPRGFCPLFLHDPETRDLPCRSLSSPSFIEEKN